MKNEKCVEEPESSGCDHENSCGFCIARNKRIQDSAKNFILAHDKLDSALQARIELLEQELRVARWTPMRCWLGFHGWIYWPSMTRRECRRCGKRQILEFYGNRTQEWVDAYGDYLKEDYVPQQKKEGGAQGA